MWSSFPASQTLPIILQNRVHRKEYAFPFCTRSNLVSSNLVSQISFMFSCQNSLCVAVLSSVFCLPLHRNPIDEYKLWLSSVYSFLQSLIGSSVLSTLLCCLVNLISFLFQNNIRNGIYPAPLQSLWAIVAILAAMHFAKHGMVHTCINAILVLMPGYVFAHQTHFANNCNFVILSLPLKLKKCKIGDHSHAWVFACVSEGTG